MQNTRNVGATARLIILTAARLIIDIGYRLVFPFLPEIARGLNVSVTDVQRLIGWRGIGSLLGIFIVPLSERFGRRPFLLLSYLLFTVGTAVVVVYPSYWLFGLSLVLAGLGKALFGVNVHATIADTVPYEVRGRSTAVLEMSWGLSFLVGAPLAGWFIARFGWQSPFAVLAIAGFGLLGLMWRYIPESHEKTSRDSPSHQPVLQMLKEHPSILAAAFFVMCNMWGNQLLFISYADWMEQRFALTLGGLGLSAIVIGCSELLGEGFVSGFSDRIGKKRFVVIAGLAASVCYALVPFIATSRWMALVALFVTFFMFEMSVVGALPIYTELAPKARTIALAATGLGSPLGRSLGAFMAPLITQWGGFQAISLASAVITLMGILVLWAGVKENEGH